MKGLFPVRVTSALCVSVSVTFSKRREFVAFVDMARNSGQRNGARAGLLGNMAAKHSKEMYGRNKTK